MLVLCTRTRSIASQVSEKQVAAGATRWIRIQIATQLVDQQSVLAEILGPKSPAQSCEAFILVTNYLQTLTMLPWQSVEQQPCRNSSEFSRCSSTITRHTIVEESCPILGADDRLFGSRVAVVRIATRGQKRRAVLQIPSPSSP